MNSTSHAALCFSLFLCVSLKLECDKLASEKSEMQRHYIMVSKACMLKVLSDLQLYTNQTIIQCTISFQSLISFLYVHFLHFPFFFFCFWALSLFICSYLQFFSVLLFISFNIFSFFFYNLSVTLWASVVIHTQASH